MAERIALHGWVLAAAWLALAAAASAEEPLPRVTPEERAAAFPDVSGTDMHAHMHDDPLSGMLLAEHFEWQGRSGRDALHWDVTGWLGHDMNRLWLRSEGERESGNAGEHELELFWGKPVAAWWDVLLGLRHDSGPGPSRSYLALGLQGLAPQWFHVEATGYAGEGGQFGVGLEVDYDWLFTNRLILTLRSEAEAWSDDDERAGIGSGLSTLAAGLRLRYELRREFAPYIGVHWQGIVGNTADLARKAGEERRETSVVAGLRFWF